MQSQSPPTAPRADFLIDEAICPACACENYMERLAAIKLLTSWYESYYCPRCGRSVLIETEARRLQSLKKGVKP